MHLVFGLPCTRNQCDSFWVIVDGMKKSSLLIPVNVTFSVEHYDKLHINEAVKFHRVPFSIRSD